MGRDSDVILLTIQYNTIQQALFKVGKKQTIITQAFKSDIRIFIYKQ